METTDQTFTTRNDAIDTLIIQALEAGDVEDARAEYDVEAIADEVLADYDGGYRQIVDEDEFWDIVADNARDTDTDRLYLTARLTRDGFVYRITLQDGDFEDLHTAGFEDQVNDHDPDFFDLVTAAASAAFKMGLENLGESALYNESANRITWAVTKED